MTTNLVISYPDISARAVYVSTSQAAATGFEVHNTIRGLRGHGYKAATAAASTTIAYDLGASVTAAPDHLIVGRADLLQSSLGGSATNSYKLQRSSDGSAWTTEQTDATFNTSTLYGTQSQDYVLSFTAGSAYRYWRSLIERTGGGTSTFPVSKVFVGTYFDFGYDPDDWQPEQIPASESAFYSGSGAGWFARNEFPIQRYRGVWLNVSDANKRTFNDKIVRYRHNQFVWLVTRTNHEILNNYRLVYCRVVDARYRHVTAKQNCWEVEATFEEVLK